MKRLQKAWKTIPFLEVMNDKPLNSSVRSDFRDFRRFGKKLRDSIPIAVRNAEAKQWKTSLVETIRDDAEIYFKAAAFYARALAVAACIPFALVAVASALHWRSVWLYFPAALLILGLAGLAGVIFSPLFTIVPPLRTLPKTFYPELLRPLLVNLEIFYLLLSVDLLGYIWPYFTFSPILPILAILTVVWLLAPWIIYLSRHEIIFSCVRISQFLILLVVAFFTVASPIPMSQYQWWAGRAIVERTRPVIQHEVTADWKTLQWFSQEGSPNIWYSGSSVEGYRLFSAPGSDTGTGEELRPVADKAIKVQIVNSFSAQEKAAQDTLNAEKRQEQADAGSEAKKAVDEQQAKLATQQAEQARQIAEGRQRRILQAKNDYVFNVSFAEAASRKPLVVTALVADRREDPSLTAAISKALSAAGVENRTDVFRPAYWASRDFQDILAGQMPHDDFFRAEDYASGLLVITVSAGTRTQGQVSGSDLLMADTALSAKKISLPECRPVGTFRGHGTGAGFNRLDASTLSEQRAISELVNQYRRAP